MTQEMIAGQFIVYPDDCSGSQNSDAPNKLNENYSSTNDKRRHTGHLPARPLPIHNDLAWSNSNQAEADQGVDRQANEWEWVRAARFANEGAHSPLPPWNPKHPPGSSAGPSPVPP